MDPDPKGDENPPQRGSDFVLLSSFDTLCAGIPTTLEQEDGEEEVANQYFMERDLKCIREGLEALMELQIMKGLGPEGVEILKALDIMQGLLAKSGVEGLRQFLSDKNHVNECFRIMFPVAIKHIFLKCEYPFFTSALMGKEGAEWLRNFLRFLSPIALEINDEGMHLEFIYWALRLELGDLVTESMNSGFWRDASDYFIKKLAFQLADEGHIDGVSLILEQNPELIRCRLDGWGGDTLLQQAAFWGHVDLVALLLEYGADPNVGPKLDFERLDDYYSPLRIALQKGSIAMVELLFNAGADGTSLCQGEPCWRMAIKSGNLEIIKLFFNGRVPLDVQDEHGMSPLMVALEYKCPEAVEWLLEMGADPNHRNCFGETALHMAVGDGNLAMVQLLLQYGAALDIRDSDNQMPLDLVGWWGRIDHLIELLEHYHPRRYILINDFRVVQRQADPLIWRDEVFSD